jgi:hypothetical protein
LEPDPNLFRHRFEPIDRHREDDRGSLVARDLRERLQVAKLHRLAALRGTSAACSSFSEAAAAFGVITLARRSRSASAWRAMARTIDSFRSTCLISTMPTLMPQASVCKSSIF